MGINQAFVEEIYPHLTNFDDDLGVVAIFASGDPILGRPLWSSPLEITFVVDVPPSQRPATKRFGSLSRHSTVLQQKIGERLEYLSYPIQYRYCQIYFEDSRYFIVEESRFRNSDLQRYVKYRGILRGVPFYVADGFVVEDFIRDVRQHWQAWQPERMETLQDDLNKLYELYGLSALPNLPSVNIDRFWVVKHLASMTTHLQEIERVSVLSVDQFIDTMPKRPGHSETYWAQDFTSRFLAGVGTHLISRCTNWEPYNYTQLADAIADFGLISHDEADAFAALCERRYLGAPVEQIKDKNTNAFLLLREYGYCVATFHEQLTHYLYHAS